MAGPHPYYPLGAEIVGYSPNQDSVLKLLFSFGGGLTALLALTLAVTIYARPALRTGEKAAILWFVLCMTPRPASAAQSEDV